MKLLQFNILDGCPSKARYEKFKAWMAKKDYDVIGLNELNDWDANKLQTHAKEWGYDHSVVFEMETSPYYVGFLSKTPIEIIRKDEENFYHGLLHVKTKGTHFLIAHLTPFESSYREKETKQIAEFVQAIKEPTVVMGDMNTLSPLDDAHYQREKLAERLAKGKILSKQLLKNGEINYQPMNTLLEAGLYDIGFTGEFTSTFPTPLEHDLTKAVIRRIDYILANAEFMKRHPIATVIKDSEVEAISDHYPIACTCYL